MGYLERLKALNSEKCLPLPLPKLPKEASGSNDSAQGGRSSENTSPAEGPSQPALEVLRACSTCAHVTGRGGCGEPVAAGLSALEGVIRYHPKGGTGCPVWKGQSHD